MTKVHFEAWATIFQPPDEDEFPVVRQAHCRRSISSNLSCPHGKHFWIKGGQLGIGEFALTLAESHDATLVIALHWETDL